MRGSSQRTDVRCCSVLICWLNKIDARLVCKRFEWAFWSCLVVARNITDWRVCMRLCSLIAVVWQHATNVGVSVQVLFCFPSTHCYRMTCLRASMRGIPRITDIRCCNKINVRLVSKGSRFHFAQNHAQMSGYLCFVLECVATFAFSSSICICNHRFPLQFLDHNSVRSWTFKDIRAIICNLL